MRQMFVVLRQRNGIELRYMIANKSEGRFKWMNTNFWECPPSTINKELTSLACRKVTSVENFFSLSQICIKIKSL